jgi:hypothetical protein
MNITKENIQFINQYLRKSEVLFDDLRIELIDHVASAVSHKMDDENLGFYDAFKIYMVENKKTILKAGMVNQSMNFKLAFSKFTGFLMLKEAVFFSVVFLFLGMTILKNVLFENLERFQINLMILLFSFSILWIILSYGVFKKRLFALENNFILLSLLFQLMNFARIIWGDNLQIEFHITLFFGLFFTLFILFMCKISFEFYRKNKNLYETN